MSNLKRTPLYETYKDSCKLVPFGGWEMPVQFIGIKQEHEAVRTRAGLFDVSHMGEVEISGPDALALIQKLTTNDAEKLQVGKAQYTLMCYPDGGTVDDLLLYRTSEETYLLVINASNIEKDVAWIKEWQTGDVTVQNRSDSIAQLAIQGPLAEKILQKMTAQDLAEIKFFSFKENVDIAGIPVLVSRSGYTGEDGFELYFDAEDAPFLWKKIIEVGGVEGLLPCGLGARDTLRFEARLPLYGQELSASISPLEAKLGFAVKLDKGEFIGQAALLKQKETGLTRQLIGLEMLDRGIPRNGYTVWSGNKQIGTITTGTQSPTLKQNIGLALVNIAYTQIDQEVEVEIRGKRLKAIVIPTPFYKRTK
ncbi:glycine cleavage system aminomethyltransferase GcvT [Hazenella sp. IB182357]|uniref:Aminomethyltransferase n=1 Tax=Polycladospora coralii TaxID=2771432 RepID=A0A926RSP6_9BACL|nr:glycine cleavage system aminomethyltransferase GcvT [Polycladospora coralii]MBD1371670.1 glycine cleavage system aminomethyltransferase GcvT [Polycladospora coralii]MBS7529137.1 glycine cleavage system aminomethyltransferase GcvT [Polycladospora coralii]